MGTAHTTAPDPRFASIRQAYLSAYGSSHSARPGSPRAAARSTSASISRRRTAVGGPGYVTTVCDDEHGQDRTRTTPDSAVARDRRTGSGRLLLLRNVPTSREEDGRRSRRISVCDASQASRSMLQWQHFEIAALLRAAATKEAAGQSVTCDASQALKSMLQSSSS